MIEIRHMRYFLEVARASNMTRAAERLHLAQPALSYNMQQLESDLGVQLFRREGRRLFLTEAGEAFASEAERTLRQFEFAQVTAQRAARGESGQLVIGLQSTTGLSVVPRMIQNFRRRYPDVEILLSEMGSVAQLAALRRGEIDIAIMYSVPHEEFSYRELTPESVLIALRQDHPLAIQESVALKELAPEALILPARTVAESLYHAVLAECADAGFQPQKVYQVNTAQTALGLVSAGLGVALLPGSVQVLERKGVVLRPVRNSRMQVQVVMLWPKENASPIVTNFLQSNETS